MNSWNAFQPASGRLVPKKSWDLSKPCPDMKKAASRGGEAALEIAIFRGRENRNGRNEINPYLPCSVRADASIGLLDMKKMSDLFELDQYLSQVALRSWRAHSMVCPGFGSLLQMNVFAIRLGIMATIALTALSTGAQAQQRRITDPNAKAAPAENPAQPKQDKQFPTGAAWIATSINGKPAIGERQSLLIDDNFRARGFGGCNTFSATSYPLRGQGFAAGPVASTRKACDKAVMDQERTFLTLFRTAQAWDTVEGAFILKGPNGELRFERSF
jgi:heat shock protein HslJ